MIWIRPPAVPVTAVLQVLLCGGLPSLSVQR